MKKLFLILLYGIMLVGFTACEQKIALYQVTLLTDELEGATAKVSKTNNIKSSDEVRVTVTIEKSLVWKNAPEVTASSAICKSLTEKDGVYTYVFTAFRDNCLIRITGVTISLNDAWVDLGLPSGTLWAICNVGATAPDGYGDYFSWGETRSKSTCDWLSPGDYQWGVYDMYGSPNYGMTKYNKNDNRTTLQSADDAATANWGAPWRMPTRTEIEELVSECTWSWTTLNGRSGCLVTSKQDINKSIFLPAAGECNETGLHYPGCYGHYWSSSLYSNHPFRAAYFIFDSLNLGCGHYCRNYGLSIRPVRSPQ